MALIYLNTVYLVFFLNYSPVHAFGDTNRIVCSEGKANTSRYVASYTIKEREIAEYGCQFEYYSYMWPGLPKDLKMDQTGSMFRITWNPPEDGSIQYLKGFLLELYDESPHIYNANPEVCFTVNLSEPLVNNVHVSNPSGALAQDAKFSLECHVKAIRMPIRLFLTSLPMPRYDRMNQISAQLEYRARTPVTSTVYPHTKVVVVDGFPDNTVTPDEAFFDSEDLMKLVAILLSCFFLVVINVVLIFLICRIKRTRGPVGHVKDEEAAPARQRLVGPGGTNN